MPRTVYTVLDLTNFVEVSHTFVNCADAAGPPGANFTGVYGDAGFTLTDANAPRTEQSSGLAQYLYDFNHATPPNPLLALARARITRVTITLQAAQASATADLSLTFDSVGINISGRCSTDCQASINPFPFPVNTAWATSDLVNLTDSDNSGYGIGLKSSSSNVNSGAGRLIGYTFDFTTNPGGAFPLGYMTQPDFLTNFTNMLFSYNVAGTVTGNWEFGPPPAHVPAPGTASAGTSLFATNFEMEVTWTIIVWWIKPPFSDPCHDQQESHLVLAAEAPSDEYQRLDPDDPDAEPTPVIDALEPDHGLTAGGTALTIRGSGFGDGATVDIDGNPATSVVVVSQYEITCVTPAHAAGATTVTVTNPVLS